MSAVHKLCWWKAQGSGSPCQLLHSLVPRSNSVISVYWERGGDGDEDDRNCSKTGVQIKIDWYPKVVCLKEMNLFLPSVKLTWCRKVHPENVSWGDISWRLKCKVSLASAFPKLLQLNIPGKNDYDHQVWFSVRPLTLWLHIVCLILSGKCPSAFTSLPHKI